MWRLLLLFLMAEGTVEEAVSLIAASGRVVEVAESLSERLSPPLRVSPGAPPVLSFRYFDAADKGRFGNLGLVTDDAGH